MKHGHFELLNVRDEYALATGEKGLKLGMHKDLVLLFIRFVALCITPIAPHFAEHLWKAILNEKGSVQNALFPKPSAPVDEAAIAAINYVRSLISQMRQTELGFMKKKAKGKSVASFDPTKPKSVKMFLTKSFPQWQDSCIEALQESYSSESKKVDNAKLKQILGSKGLMKEKRAMPFCMLYAVRLVVSYAPQLWG
jgi:leucyl-tRNA synthetase